MARSLLQQCGAKATAQGVFFSPDTSRTCFGPIRIARIRTSKDPQVQEIWGFARSGGISSPKPRVASGLTPDSADSYCLSRACSCTLRPFAPPAFLRRQREMSNLGTPANTISCPRAPSFRRIPIGGSRIGVSR